MLIDQLPETASRYYLALSGVGYDIEPEIVFNWSTAFDHPWRENP